MYETQHNARHTSTQGMPMHGVECVFPKRTDGHALWSKSACVLSRFCHVQLFVTLWTRACQDPGLWDSPVRNTGVGCHALLQGIFLTQGPNPHRFRLMHWQAGFLPRAASGSPWSKSISFQRKNSFRNQNIQGPVSIPIPFLRSRYSSGLRELRVGPASSEAHTGSLSRVGYKELIFHTIQPVKMQQPSRSGEQSNSPAGFYSH